MVRPHHKQYLHAITQGMSAPPAGLYLFHHYFVVAASDGKNADKGCLAHMLAGWNASECRPAFS
jgi:hypothetical protein